MATGMEGELDQVPMRRSAKEEQIVAAALDILRDRGPAAVNMESVSAASGIAKSTIYRRFSNRDELIASAVASVTAAPVVPEGLDIEEELRWAVQRCRDGVEHVLGLGGVTGVLVDQDPLFSSTIRAMLVPWIALVRDILVRGATSGRFRRDLDVDVALNFILGASLGEFLRAGSASDEWTERVVRMLLLMLRPAEGCQPAATGPGVTRSA